VLLAICAPRLSAVDIVKKRLPNLGLAKVAVGRSEMAQGGATDMANGRGRISAAENVSEKDKPSLPLWIATCHSH